MWAVYSAACCLTLWLGLYYCAASRYTSQTNSHPCLIKSSIENVFVERKEIFRAENTSADNSRPFVFPKTAALTPTQIASVFVGLEVGKFISNSFFFSSLSFSVSCKTAVDFFTLLWADSQTGTQVIRAIKIVKASRIPYLTLWWDFIALMRHPSYSGQEVCPWKRSHSWFVGIFHHLQWFMSLKWLFLRARMKLVISAEFAWDENTYGVFLMGHLELAPYFAGHLLYITAWLLSKWCLSSF